MKEGHDIVKTVLLTEKATLLSEAQGKYVFKVAPKANKLEIKAAIEQAFNIKVLSVNTCNYRGKMKRLRTRQAGRRANWKKAIIALPAGEKLDLI